MSSSTTPDEQPAATLPRYASHASRPRDLRSAQELKAHGYERLGAPAALLQLPDGQLQELFSTSEARRLRDGLWPRAGRESHNRNAAPPRRGSHTPLKQLESQGAVLPRNPAWLAELFATDFVVIDTETTGLGAGDEIIEIAAITADGQPLLEQKVWPHQGRVPAASSRVHGLVITDLEGAPTWPEVLLELERLLSGRRVLAWNAPFDHRMSLQSSRKWGLEQRLPPFECAMRGYALSRGIGSGRLRLERAASVEQVLAGPQQHRSLGDARLTLAVLKQAHQKRQAPA